MFKQLYKNFVHIRKVNFSVCSKVNQKLVLDEKGPLRMDFSSEENGMRSIFPLIHDEILEEQLVLFKNFPELKERYSKLIYYTLDVDTKFLSKGLGLIYIYKALEKPSLLTSEKLRQAYILGWAHKLIDASVLVDDDIVDESDLRYNKPAWYKLPDVGKNLAIFDAAFLESGAHFLLLKHFSSHPQFVNILKELIKCYSSNNVAQIMETRKRSLSDYEKYQNFEKFYAFTLSCVSSALYLANINDTAIHKALAEIFMDFAQYLKIEDDVSGVFSPVTDTQKVCTDVALGRISWLAIEAYKRGSPIQKEILEKHYGKKSHDSVLEMHNIFIDLKLDKVFNKFKKEFYDKEVLKIKELPKSVPNQIFLTLLTYVISGKCRV